MPNLIIFYIPALDFSLMKSKLPWPFSNENVKWKKNLINIAMSNLSAVCCMCRILTHNCAALYCFKYKSQWLQDKILTIGIFIEYKFNEIFHKKTITEEYKIISNLLQMSAPLTCLAYFARRAMTADFPNPGSAVTATMGVSNCSTLLLFFTESTCYKLSFTESMSHKHNKLRLRPLSFNNSSVFKLQS